MYRPLFAAVMLLLLMPNAHAASSKGFVRHSDQALGKRFEVKPESLPKPNPKQAVTNPPVTIDRGSRKPQVPKGFEVTLFAGKLDNPRQMLVLPNGDVLVAEEDANQIMLLRASAGRGKVDMMQLFAKGFAHPYGLAYRQGEVLVSDTKGIWKLPYDEDGIRVGNQGAANKSTERQPLTNEGAFGGQGGHAPSGHVTRSLAIDPKDGSIYVGIGSAGNVDVEALPRASIQVFDKNGQNQRTFASGMRNPIGIGFHPDTGALWAIVQERDNLGNRLVPDYFTHVEKNGFYGWPYSYVGQNPQPGFAEKSPDKPKQAIVPDLLFESHSAAMDFVFYTADQFPQEYRGDAFVALRGSWNRADPRGYKVVRVKFDHGKPVGWYENFITGFWTHGDKRAEVWGRPVDVAIAKDGSLLVADDTGGTIWRISYRGDAQSVEKP